MARRADQVIAPRPRRHNGHTAESSTVHKTYRYQRLRKQFRALCTQRKTPCWLCGHEIDYTAKALDPNAFELDHAHPVSTHPELAYDLQNFRASHSRCNRARRADTAPQAEEWVRPDW